MAVREGGDQHFLRVNGCFHSPLADNMRRSRRGNDCPPVKAQSVASAVTALKKVLAAGQLPIDVRRIGRHRFPLSEDALGWDTVYQTPVGHVTIVKLPHIYLVASGRDHQGIPLRQLTDRLLILGDRERLQIRRDSCFPIQIEF